MIGREDGGHDCVSFDKHHIRAPMSVVTEKLSSLHQPKHDPPSSYMTYSSCGGWCAVEQVMAERLWDYMTPWLKSEVDAVIRKATNSTEKETRFSPFVGIHIRRGDKIAKGEANVTSSEVGVRTTRSMVG